MSGQYIFMLFLLLLYQILRCDNPENSAKQVLFAQTRFGSASGLCRPSSIADIWVLWSLTVQLNMSLTYDTTLGTRHPRVTWSWRLLPGTNVKTRLEPRNVEPCDDDQKGESTNAKYIVFELRETPRSEAAEGNYRRIMCLQIAYKSLIKPSVY